MKEGFKEAFQRFKFLRIQDLVSLFGLSSLKSFEKGEIIAEPGTYCECAFLIRKGIIRTYVLTPDGEERTIRFAREKEFTACSASFLRGEPATEYLQAMEDVKVVAINTEKLKKLTDENIRVLKLAHEGIKEAFTESIKRVEFFTIYTPEERYRILLKDSPDLLQRIPQKYLASYMGITTVSLSRIRSRVLSG